MSRVRSLLTASALGGLGGSLVTGHATLIVAFVILSLGVVPLWIDRTLRGDSVDRSWSARSEVVVAADAPIGLADRSPLYRRTVEPTALCFQGPRLSARPLTDRGDRPPVGRVAWALGRVEARELFVNPWFGVGIGLCLVMVLGFAPDYDGTGGETWGRIVQDLLFLAHPLVGMAVLASHQAATRAHRDRTIELFECCPTASRTRSAGAMFAAWVPAAALAVFFVTFLASVDLFSPVHAAVGPAAAPNVVAGLVLGVGGAALGVALGRWVRFPLAPVVAILLVGFVSLRLADGGGDPVARQLLSTFPPLGDPTPTFTASEAWVHAAWLIAITVVTAAVALAPAPRRGRLSVVTP